MVQGMMSRLGLDAARFGAHSLRIGGATAALAAGLSPAAIRAAGRWSSDVYAIYCRLSRQSAAGVATLVGSTPFEDVERGVQFVDEELMLTSMEMPSAPVESFVERDLIDDAFEEEL
jgi:ABC-type Co2+ transport system permease subunit